MTIRTKRNVCIAGALAFAVASAAIASAYVLNGPKWGTPQVGYYINPVNSDMSESAAISGIQTGAFAWTQSNANILPYYLGRTSASTISRNGQSEIFFRNASAGSMAGETYWWYDGSFKLIEADIALYDGGFTFFSGSSGCLGGVYLEDVVAHEFGHALGLGHSSDPAATMYPSLSWCSTSMRTLDSDDLAGIEALYPSGSAPDPSPNTAPGITISSPGSASTVVEGTSITFTGSATDNEDGNLSAGIVWRSSIDGAIGTGSSLNRVLSNGSHVVTASVADSGGLTATQTIIVTVTAGTTDPGTPSPITLIVSPSKVKGVQRVALTWTGAITGSVILYRDGVPLMTTANDGYELDLLNRKGSATYTYSLCESGTSNCSNIATAIF